jgi:hypothetical protein
MKIVIYGITSFGTRKAFAEYINEWSLEENGYEEFDVCERVTKDTEILVTYDGNASPYDAKETKKYKDADTYGVRILTEAEFLDEFVK